MRQSYLSLIIISLVTILSAQYVYRPVPRRQESSQYVYQPVPRREDYDTSESPESTAPNWMAFIEHHRSISTLSIPGTHMSMSFSGGAKNQRQSWPLYRQYEAGIRFVDIRCRHYRNNLYVYHGPGTARHTMDAIFRETIKYLDAYPSEVILMRIRRESTSHYNRDNMGDTLKKLLVKYPAYRIWASGRVPTMSDARGRIVIIQDFYGPQQIGLQYRYLTVEDNGNPRDQNSINYKWQRVQHHLNSAMRGNPGTMYIAHTAGDGAGVNPHTVANRMNRKLWDFLAMYSGQRMRWGIISMDFPGAKIIKRVIESNL